MSEAKSDWILMKDQKPFDGQAVLICDANEKFTIGIEAVFWTSSFDDSLSLLNAVTHWMPLPKLPDK